MTLTATISIGDSQATKEFVVTLLPKDASVEQTTVQEKLLKDDLLLHYDMKTTAEEDGQLVLKDVANKKVTFDGIFKNANHGQLISNSEVGFISFNGGGSTSNSGYVEIPKGTNGLDLLQGLNEITVSSIVNWTNDGTNRWIFGLGTMLTPETNKYFS